jgi:hypothetical protein
MLVVDASWEGVPECLVYQAEVGISTIGVPAGERWRYAEVFRATATKSTTAIGASQPGNTDSIADTKPAGSVTKCIDDANHLVTRRNVGTLWGQVSLG